jgi:hypothetical protein
VRLPEPEALVDAATLDADMSVTTRTRQAIDDDTERLLNRRFIDFLDL